ncbi:MAG: acyl carrier protein [Rhizobium sp.]|nr:acyl carrier protein [Rhizobium sp.]
MSDKLIELFADELGVDTSELSDASSPETVERWDSLAAMRLVAAMESEFNVSLSGKEVMKMRSIGIAREVLLSKGVTF